MGALSKKSLKRKLGTKLIYSPFIRLVLFNTWFQAAFGAMVLVMVFLALYLPKIWQTSPDHFLPVVKVSGLDMTQNWSLKRAARNSIEKRDFKRASQSWEAAVAQNPGDVDALRGYLSNTLNLERADRHVFRSAISQMNWLFRLTRTNQSDVQLAAQVCEKFKWHEVGAYYLGKVDSALPPAAEATYLKALFQLGRLHEFKERFAASSARLSDAEMPLYHLAFKAASRAESGSDEAERELERISESGDSGEQAQLAARLHMLACGKKGNVEGYARSLQKLALRNGDTVIDHAVYWVLLSRANRKAEAVKLAESFTSAPTSALETVRLADAYYQLGLLEAGRELLDQFAPTFHQSPEVWVAYAAVLEELGDWAGMRAIAVQIREDLGGRDTLWGYAYLLEGRAELAAKRLASADRAFEKAAESLYEIPPLGLAVARELTRIKYHKFALKIYNQLESAYERDLRFWEGVFDAAFAVQDAIQVLKATEHCYRLNPNDVQVHNRYAAALIVNRSNPEEIIRLTLELIHRYPRSLAAMLNHTFALLINQRTAEAKALLERIDPHELSPVEMSSYHLARFELNYNLELWDEAAEAGAKISRATLFPVQRRWLDEALSKLPPRQVAISK